MPKAERDHLTNRLNQTERDPFRHLIEDMRARANSAPR